MVTHGSLTVNELRDNSKRRTRKEAKNSLKRNTAFKRLRKLNTTLKPLCQLNTALKRLRKLSTVLKRLRIRQS